MPSVAGSIEMAVSLIAIAVAVWCVGLAGRNKLVERGAWAAIGVILFLLALTGLGIGAGDGMGYSGAAVLPTEIWRTVVLIGALGLVGLVSSSRRTFAAQMPEARMSRIGAMRVAVGFAAFAALSMAASADSFFESLAAIELAAAAAFCTAVLWGRAPVLAASIPLAGFSLLILLLEVIGAALLIGAGGASHYMALGTLVSAEIEPRLAFGFAVIIAALSARLIWFVACYGIAVRRDPSARTHLVFGLLILPAILLTLTYIVALSASALAPAFRWGAEGGYAFGLVSGVWMVLRARTPDTMLLWSAIIGALMIVFSAVFLGASSQALSLVLVVQLMLAIGVLSIVSGEDGARPATLATAGLIALGAAGLAGAPPFLGFWGHWGVGLALYRDGAEWGLAIVLVTLAGLALSWARHWHSQWTVAARAASSNVSGTDAAPPPGWSGRLGVAFAALGVLLVLSVRPGFLLGALP